MLKKLMSSYLTTVFVCFFGVGMTLGAKEWAAVGPWVLSTLLASQLYLKTKNSQLTNKDMARLNIKSTKQDAIELLKVVANNLKDVPQGSHAQSRMEGYIHGVVDFAKELGIKITEEDYK